MICFNENLKNTARTILSAQSTADELSSANDISMAENMLSALNQQPMSAEQYFDLHQKAVTLNQSLRQKYPLINELQAVANRLGEISPNPKNHTPNKADDIQHRLRMDVRGILATVLVKHQIVSGIKEVLEDRENSDELIAEEGEDNGRKSISRYKDADRFVKKPWCHY